MDGSTVFRTAKTKSTDGMSGKKQSMPQEITVSLPSSRDLAMSPSRIFSVPGVFSFSHGLWHVFCMWRVVRFAYRIVVDGLFNCTICNWVYSLSEIFLEGNEFRIKYSGLIIDYLAELFTFIRNRFYFVISVNQQGFERVHLWFETADFLYSAWQNTQKKQQSQQAWTQSFPAGR